MKNYRVARGITGAVASLLGVVAIGCGADVGTEGEGASGSGEIGSVEQALNGTAPVVETDSQDLPAGLDTDVDPDTDNTQTAAGRIFAGSCVITQNGVDKLLVVGGFDSAGNGLNDLLVYEPGTPGSWVHRELVSGRDGEVLSAARGYLQVVKTASNKCLAIGGEATFNGTASNVVDEIVANNDGTFTVNTRTPMDTARSRFKASTCDSRVIVFGGFDNSQLVPANKFIGSIEISDDFDPGDWVGRGNLSTPAYDMALAKDPGTNRYLVTGGTSNGALLATSDVVVASSCSSNLTITNQSGAGKVITAATGLVSFFEGSRDIVSNPNTTTFVISGGKIATPDATLKAYEAVVSWSSPPVLAISDANTADMATEMHLPTLVQTDTDAHMLLGGTDGEGPTGHDAVSYLTDTDLDTPATSNVQQYEDGQSWYTAQTLHFSGRAYGVAEKIGGVVYYVTGVSITSGTPTYLQSMELITP